VIFDPNRRDFFEPERKNIKNLTILGEIFQIQTQSIDGWPDPTWVKNFDPDPSQLKRSKKDALNVTFTLEM